MAADRCGISLAFVVGLCCVAIPAHTRWVQKRVTPVQISACGSERGHEAEKLFDGKRGREDKWCCYHAGYNTQQTHWVNVDLGQTYLIAQCVVYHEGSTGNDLSHYNTEDFSISGSEMAIQGPWTPIAAVTDNIQPFNVVQGNNAKARYLRLEVTDPQSLNSPGKPNQDFATRIPEWEIFVWENQTNGPDHASSPPAPAMQTVPSDNGSSSTSPGVRRVLFYFFLNEHTKSRVFYESVILKRENWPIVTRFTVIPVEMNSDPAKVQVMGVYKSPTSVITTPDGRKVADLPGVTDEQEFLKFLQAHVK